MLDCQQFSGHGSKGPKGVLGSPHFTFRMFQLSMILLLCQSAGCQQLFFQGIYMNSKEQLGVLLLPQIQLASIPEPCNSHSREHTNWVSDTRERRSWRRARRGRQAAGEKAKQNTAFYLGKQFNPSPWLERIIGFFNIF